jgi:hypothetical protein
MKILTTIETFELPLSKPALQPLFKGSKMSRELTEDYYIQINYDNGKSFSMVIPAGYEYDASIPAIPLVRVLIGAPYDPDLEAAAAGHDWMYQGHFTTRKFADQRFYDILEICFQKQNSSKLTRYRNATRRYLMLKALRWVGWRAWPISKADSEYMETIRKRVLQRGVPFTKYIPRILIDGKPTNIKVLDECDLH